VRSNSLRKKNCFEKNAIEKGGIMKAYIISPEDGTVVIGITLYQPSRNKSYYVGKTFITNPDDFPSVEVEHSSMESAIFALKKFAEMSQKS
jgi:hypothetical protein